MEGEKGGDKVAMETVWNILEEVIELLDSRTEVTIIVCEDSTLGVCGGKSQ